MASRNAQLDLPFADGTYTFRLAIGGLEELQEKTNVGPMVLLRRLLAGEWRVADLRETIRIGLIGGGMAPQEARKLVDRYVDAGGLLEAVPIATGIVGAALQGVDDEKVGSSGEASAAGAETEATDASPSPGSMEMAL